VSDDRVDAARAGRTSAKWRAFPPDVMPLWVAEMDFPLAAPIAQALHAAIDRSDVGYRWAGDLPEAYAAFAARRLGWQPDPARVIVLGDILAAIAESLRRLTGPDDAVVITPPIYPPFFGVTRDIVQRPIVEVPLAGRELDLDGLEEAFRRPEVTAFLLSQPHNPTGAIVPLDTLATVAELARRHGVVVISDEVWTPLPLGGRSVPSYLSLGEELTGLDVALVSASKAFNLAGLKCAQVVAGSVELADRLRATIPVEVTYAAGQLGIIASVAAYREGDAWLDATLARITDNAALLGDLLRAQLPEVRYTAPQATYLAWLDCRDLGLGDDPAAAFLEHGRVALNPGPDFGAPGRGFVRLNLATTPDVIEEAVERMSRAVAVARGGGTMAP